MESLTFQERLQRWNSPTAPGDFTSAARAASQRRSAEGCPNQYEEKNPIDRNALRELIFQMTVEGKRLGVQLDFLHQAASENESPKYDPQKTQSADLRKRTCSIEKEVRALGRRVEELQDILREGEGKLDRCENHGKFEDLTKRADQSSSEDLKAKLEVLESEKQALLKERKECDREIQFLKCQLQYREEIKALQEKNESDKTAQENALLLKENQELRQKLDSVTDAARGQGFAALAEELSSPLSPPSAAGDPKLSELENELKNIRKERKILLDTVLKQQTTRQCIVEHNGPSEGVDLQKQVSGLRIELEDLEKENKNLDDENNKLTEENTTLNDQVVKLKSQIADAIESDFDEMENLHEINEKLQERFNLLQRQNARLREASNEFKERCATHFEAALAEMEENKSCEDVMDYLTKAIDHLLDFDDEATALTASEPTETQSYSGNSALRSQEIKAYKDLIEDQRQQIRQVQFEKRDLEENVSKMKRELMILKSIQRQEKRRDLAQPRNVADAVDSHEPRQENACLKSQQSELEKLIRTLKEENYKLENEKFSLLGSFYHLLERNEALEEQVAKIKQVGDSTNPSETPKAGLQQEAVPAGSRVPCTNSLGSSVIEHDPHHELPEDLESEIHRIGEQLRYVHESVLNTQEEKVKLKDEIGEKGRNEEEFRVSVKEMNYEVMVLKGRVEKAQEMNNTLQECLRQVNDERQELVTSLGKSSEEKAALERSLVDMENRLSGIQKEKAALEKALDGMRIEDVKSDKANEQLEVMFGKVFALSRALAREVSGQTEAGEIDKDTMDLDTGGLCDRLSLVLENVSKAFERLRATSKEYKLDAEKIAIRLNSVLVEKQALQKYVRELDERKRQMKVFITKLTEEKEAMAEDMDEIKQQKMNLADALENVYHNKEGLQNKLDETTLKLEQFQDSLRQSADESKTLRESLCRVVKERDALRVALLTEKRQSERLRESEGKWRELALGSHTEADQIIEVDRAIKEEIANELTKVEESQMAQLDIDREELLIATEKAQKHDGEETCETVQKGTDAAAVESVQLEDDRQHETLLSSAGDQTRGGVRGENNVVSPNADSSPVDRNKWQRQEEKFEEKVKQITEENEQLTSWLDAVVVEKGRVEQELESTTEENKELVRDLHRLSKEKEQLKLTLDKISTEIEVGYKVMNIDCLEQNVQRATEARTPLANDLERVPQQVEDLINRLSSIRQENSKLCESLEAARGSSKVFEIKYNQLLEDNKSMKNLNTECNQQADALRLDNAQLSESKKRLAEDLERALQTARELHEEVRVLSDDNQSMKEDTERAKEREAELKKILKVAQDAREGLAGCMAELTSVKEASEEKCQQLVSQLEHLNEEQNKLKHAEEQVKLLETENQNLNQQIQAARNVISEMRTDKESVAQNLADKDKRMEEEASKRDQVLEKLSKELTDLAAENVDMKRTLKEAQDGACASKSQLEQSNKRTKSLQQELEVSSKELKKKQSENDDLKLCVSEMGKEKSNLQKSLKDLECKNATMQREIQAIQDNLAKLAEENRKLEAQAREKETSLKDVQEERNNLQNKLKVSEETKKSLCKLQEEREDLKKCVASLDKDKRTLQRKLKDGETKLNEVERTWNEEQLRIKELEHLLNNAVEENQSYHNSNLEREEENRALEKSKQELEARIKDRGCQIEKVTEEKKRLEKELSRQKSVVADLQIRLDEANEDKNELEEILTQQRDSCKSLKEELETAVFGKRATEEKLHCALDELGQVAKELRGKKSYSEERDNQLKESKDEIESLRRKLKETTDEVCAVRRKLKGRTLGQDTKCSNVSRQATEESALKEIEQLAREVSSVIEENEGLAERLGEAEVEVSILENKLRQQEEEMNENRKCLERSQQSSVRLDAALESAKVVENRLRRQVEEFQEKERAAKLRLQITERAEQDFPTKSPAGQQECAAERVLVTCVDVPELSKVSSTTPTRTEDRKSAPNLGNADKDVALLESQVRKLRSELRLANDRVFDLEEDLSDSKRTLKQKERLHQQERTRFQRDIGEIEKECDRLRKRLSSFGEMEARRSSFSAVMDLKGTLRKAESDMCNVITKTARLLQRAKDEMEGAVDAAEGKEAISQADLVSRGSSEEIQELRDKFEAQERQNDQLNEKVRRLEGEKHMMKQTIVNTLADAREFQCRVGIDSESSTVHAREQTKSRKKPAEEEMDEICSLQDAESLCNQLEEFRKILKDLKKRLGEEGREIPKDKSNFSREREGHHNTIVPESTLHKTLEAVQLLQTEKMALEGQCKVLQSKVREVAEGKNQLLEDALSFKVKYLKKNQELTSLLETKKDEVISLQTKNEGLVSTVQQLESDSLLSGKELESLRLQAQTTKLEKERIELTNTEQQSELETLRKVRSRYDELTATLESLSSAVNKLEEENKALAGEKTQITQHWEEEKAQLSGERDALASKLSNLEEENKLESSLKAARDNHLRERENKLAEEFASIKKEKENLGNVNTKMQQMRNEYTRLESEYNVLLDHLDETKAENTKLTKENLLVRKACEQLRARKTLAEEKIPEEVGDVDRVRSLERKPERAIIKESVIPLHKAAPKEEDWRYGRSSNQAHKRHSIARSDNTDGLLIPISLSGQKNNAVYDRRRACSLPTEQGTEAALERVGITTPYQTALPSSSDSSSRSSDAGSSVCSRRHYCSPILSVVDLCPLHHDSPPERKPSPCPVCRKKKERKIQKGFVSSEKYV